MYFRKMSFDSYSLSFMEARFPLSSKLQPINYHRQLFLYSFRTAGAVFFKYILYYTFLPNVVNADLKDIYFLKQCKIFENVKKILISFCHKLKGKRKNKRGRKVNLMPVHLISTWKKSLFLKIYYKYNNEQCNLQHYIGCLIW